ncbi:MAG: acyltransferase [Sphingomonas sp.]
MTHAPVLDGFRALAILIVMVSHAGLGKFVPGGFGVTIFFFLSGYLITSLLRIEAANTGKIDIPAFYMRRTIRIFPPLYITGGIVAALCINGMLDNSISGQMVLLDGLFLTNYSHLTLDNFGQSLPMPLWSLDVEEHFYLIFSTVFALVVGRLAPAKAAMWCAIACGAILMVRVANVVLLSDFSQNYYWSHTRMDSILFGCVLAMWNNPAIDRDAWRPKLWHVGAALVTLVLCLVVRNPVFRETIRYTLQGIALFVLFAAALQNKGIVARVLGSTPLRWIALISYTLYLIHLPLLLIFYRYQVPGAALFGIAAAVIYSTLMYLAVERPLGEWRRKRNSKRSAVDTQPAMQGN